MIQWGPDPEIFRIGFFALRWYSLMFMFSFAFGLVLFRYIYRREGKNLADLDDLLLYMLLATILGARLGHVIFYDPAYYFSHPLTILKVWEGGLASHGGAIGIFIALYLYTRRKKNQPYLWLLDRMAIGVALAGSLIRLGNFFNSEIIGKAAPDLPWAIIMNRVDMIPRHPAQLYESISYLLIFILLIFIYKKSGEKTPRGLLLGLFSILVFGARFVIEFFKENQSAFESGMTLNMGQILSIPMVLLGLYLIYTSRTRPL